MSQPRDSLHPLLPPTVREYLDLLGGDEDPLLVRMERMADLQGFPTVGRDAGRWLELLARMVGARRVFEMGSGFGYSAFFFARAVGSGGEVVGAEHDEALVAEHRRLFAGHPLEPRIRLVQGHALDLLEREPAPWDVVFLDLEKEDYPLALEAAIPRVRPGGLVIADNVLWGGRAATLPEPGDEASAAIRRFNMRLFGSHRLLAGIVPVGDGLGVGLRIE